MDSISPVSGSPASVPTFPVKSPTPAPTTDTPIPAQPVVQHQQDSAPPAAQADTAYQAALRQAAISFKNVYAVSDTNFTIFKDTTGKYITRYVSLRDGSVTYIPEPTLVKELQMSGGHHAFSYRCLTRLTALKPR